MPISNGGGEVVAVHAVFQTYSSEESPRGN